MISIQANRNLLRWRHLACPPRTSQLDRPGDQKPGKAKGENRDFAASVGKAV